MTAVSCKQCGAPATVSILHVASGKRYQSCRSDKCQELLSWRSWGIDYRTLPTVGEMEAADAEAAAVD